jgi:ligand-binding sensor domain-containing protein
VAISVQRAAICVLVLSSIPSVSQGQQYSFKDYVDGLGNLSVNCLLQDRSGFLWIGTESGLYQYDGSRFWRFGKKEGLTNEFVRALSLDRDGRLWVGTRDGLAFSTGQRSFSTVTYQQQNLRVPYDSTLSSSPDGRIYAVTQFGVLVVKSKDQGRSWQASPLEWAGKNDEIDLCPQRSGQTRWKRPDWMRARAVRNLPWEAEEIRKVVRASGRRMEVSAAQSEWRVVGARTAIYGHVGAGPQAV